jgi:hypothetical protein
MKIAAFATPSFSAYTYSDAATMIASENRQSKTQSSKLTRSARHLINRIKNCLQSFTGDSNVARSNLILIYHGPQNSFKWPA